MAKQRKSKALSDCKSFYKLLLYEASGGNLGIQPKKAIESETVTFVEKNRLLAEMGKIAAMEVKELEDQPEVSGLDMIRSRLNGDRENRGRGNSERTNKSGLNDAETGDSEADA